MTILDENEFAAQMRHAHRLVHDDRVFANMLKTQAEVEVEFRVAIDDMTMQLVNSFNEIFKPQKNNGVASVALANLVVSFLLSTIAEDEPNGRYKPHVALRLETLILAQELLVSTGARAVLLNQVNEGNIKWE